MKFIKIASFFAAVLLAGLLLPVSAQQSPVQDIFPKGTITYGNIPYANDHDVKHLLDIYLPANANNNLPLVVWVHGGAWMMNDKYADMGYMKNTVKGFLDSGYALASIDYRHSTTAIFRHRYRTAMQRLSFSINMHQSIKLIRTKLQWLVFQQVDILRPCWHCLITML